MGTCTIAIIEVRVPPTIPTQQNNEAPGSQGSQGLYSLRIHLSLSFERQSNYHFAGKGFS